MTARRAVPVVVGVMALWAAAALPVPAFTPLTRLLIVERACKVAPPALARQLERHKQDLRAAAVEGVGNDGAVSAKGERGAADRRLALEIDRAVELLDQHAPMRDVAQAFGRVARTTADLSYALQAGPQDPREPTFAPRFARFVESRLPRITVTFDGFADRHLAIDDVAGFAGAVAAQARRDYSGIVHSYYPAGRSASAEDFDDRSVAFAAASLEVSLAVNTTAKAWLHIWHRANGDLGGTPFLDPADFPAPFSPHDAPTAPRGPR